MVRAYLKTLRPRGSLSCSRKRRSAWWTTFGVGTSNFSRGMRLGAGRSICHSACLISHFFAVSSCTLAASDNFLSQQYLSSSPWGCSISLQVRRPSRNYNHYDGVKKSSKEPEGCVAQSNSPGAHKNEFTIFLLLTWLIDI